MSRVCQVYLAPRQSSDPLPDRETFSGEPIHVEPLAAQEHKSLLIEGCWHQVVAPWRVYVCVGTRPLMNVDVILRVARKMFTVSIYCLLIGMNPASPLLQGRAEPKNDLPVFFCDLTKGVYIYIYLFWLIHINIAPPIGASCNAMFRPPWMECPFLFASVRRDVCQRATFLLDTPCVQATCVVVFWTLDGANGAEVLRSANRSCRQTQSS